MGGAYIKDLLGIGSLVVKRFRLYGERGETRTDSSRQ